jgi:DNA-binding NtrC family response regulator
MPGIDGLALLRRARELDSALPVVVITAFATIESAVSAIKGGAFDYLPKNFPVDQLTLVVERALRQRRLALENLHLREQLRRRRSRWTTSSAAARPWPRCSSW